MSNFRCEFCGKAILDSPYKGYTTFCEHYPLKEKNILSPNMKGRISHEEVKKIERFSKKELIKWAEGEILEYKKFIKDLNAREGFIKTNK